LKAFLHYLLLLVFVSNLMNAGVNYAQEVGLTLGVAPTAKQLNKLTEDLVWMEKKQ
jgi:hypothetical protein